ncbi:FAD binding domain-containing protein [Antarcticimicrobium sediminis]|uniref:Xanthine dehydrogenase family protein subunit M n=1 Tax=Antarcticimicrobium sediminis TaxID=2546227 RepID=A0A4R5EKY7_9RHOB|nr:xanthine dehydrogenase family protein subunit M [Antarcticimicrobium sediminis]TDE34943.1 xanthine dehydrogenase family protein subunit M [Antarcticimicrobium sediminis]
MKPASFTYHRPGCLDDALGLMATLGVTAKPLAGGQSLGPMMNMRLARPEHVVDLNDLLELDFVRVTDAVVEIGALTRHHRVATDPEIARALPLLAKAAQSIGHYAIRQRGTLGGSLVHADPAAQYALVAITLDAEVVIRSARTTRVVPAVDFVQSIMTVDLAPDELVTAVRFRRLAPAEGWGFEMFSRRHGDFALVSVALTLRRDGHGAISNLRLGVGGVGPVPERLAVVERDACRLAADVGTIAVLARQAADNVTPEDDPQVPANYRRELVEAVTARALTAAVLKTESPS